MFTGLAQLVEHWSPKPGVGSSSLSTRASINRAFEQNQEKIRNNFTLRKIKENINGWNCKLRKRIIWRT